MKSPVHWAMSVTPVAGHSPRLFLDHCMAFRHRLPARAFPGPLNARVTHCKHFAVGNTQSNGEERGGERKKGVQGKRGRGGGERYRGWVFDAILNRWRTLYLMFGHVFRPGHAFCYHFPCTFVRLKCCFSARETTQSSGVARNTSSTRAVNGKFSVLSLLTQRMSLI